MDYSIPPTTTTTSSMALSYKGKLPIRFLHRHVYYPTHFAVQGYGYRSLTPIELCKIFGLDILLTIGAANTVQHSFFPVVPVPMLDTLLSPLLTYASESNVSAKVSLPPIYQDEGYTYLPVLNMRLPHQWYQQESISISAVKHDNADVVNAIWDQRITLLFTTCSATHLNTLRKFLLQVMYRKLFLEFRRFILHKYNNVLYLGTLHGWKLNKGGVGMDHDITSAFSKDMQAGRDVLSAYLNSNFMTWDRGSTLIFWRWPSSLQVIARDGIPPFQLKSWPNNQKPHRGGKRQDQELIFEKILVYLKKGYLQCVAPEFVQSYVDYFHVPKGLTDIRLVFNGTSCGGNEALFA